MSGFIPAVVRGAARSWIASALAIHIAMGCSLKEAARPPDERGPSSTDEARADAYANRESQDSPAADPSSAARTRSNAAVAEEGAQRACGRFLQAVEGNESCDVLAAKLDEVAGALQKGVSNHTGDPTIDRCLTVALIDRCKGSGAYESSNRYVVGAIMAMR